MLVLAHTMICANVRGRMTVEEAFRKMQSIVHGRDASLMI